MDYAHPEVLVTTEWVAAHLSDASIRLIEVDVDTTAYDSGHIAGAVGWNWQCGQVRNYDGSWTEWGNLVGAPIAKGEEP